MTGLALTIVSDLEGGEAEAAYPQALKGDVLCVLGAALYAGSNVMQEDFVKNHDRVSILHATTETDCCVVCMRCRIHMMRRQHRAGFLFFSPPVLIDAVMPLF